MERRAKHTKRKLTAEERKRVQTTRQWAAEHAAEIRQLAKLYRDQPHDSVATLDEVLALLKAERLRQQLSLADMHERSGIERPNLSRLENEAAANPTVATLKRYAEALGKRLLVVLDDVPAASS